MQQQKQPFSLMAFIKPHRAGFLASVILAVLSVASGMVPYFAVARMVNLLICSSLFFTASPPDAPMKPLSMCCRNCGGLWRIS